MKQLIDEFNKVYPAYRSLDVADYTFDEDENIGKSDTFQYLTINGINACLIPKHIIKNITLLYKNAESNDVLRKDPDGIFLIEESGIKYIYIVEMKSSYSKSNIVKAKDQVVGSYLKLHSLFSLLQSYNPTEWIVRGIIASFSPEKERVLEFMRRKDDGDIGSSFCYIFQRDKKYIMPESNCKRCFSPLNVPEVTLYYVGVPLKADRYTVDFKNIIM